MTTNPIILVRTAIPSPLPSRYVSVLGTVCASTIQEDKIEIAAIQAKGVRAGFQFTLTSIPKGQRYAGMFSNIAAEPVSVAEAVNTLRFFLPVQP